jgi:endonuclease G
MQQGEYIDKNGLVIPKDAHGKIDAERVVWLDNRGVRISAIMTWLSENEKLDGNPFVSQLFSPTYNDDKQLAFLSLPQKQVESQPALIVEPLKSAPSIPQNIVINISLGNKAAPVVTRVGLTDISFEKNIEDDVDYSDCTGFDEYFMEEHTPMPRVSEKLKKKIAYLLDNPNAYTLKYCHFSIIFHAVRRMPLVSAINILGNKRFKALSGREDKWFRDRRIDLDIQLNDEYYTKSGFDRGHMVRREDAEWGSPSVLPRKRRT